MKDKYYIFEDKNNSFATLFRTNPENRAGTLEDLGDSTEVIENTDYGNYRDYLLIYRGRKGGTRVMINNFGEIELYAMDNNKVTRQITKEEAIEYLKNMPKKPQTG